MSSSNEGTRKDLGYSMKMAPLLVTDLHLNWLKKTMSKGGLPKAQAEEPKILNRPVATFVQFDFAVAK